MFQEIQQLEQDDQMCIVRRSRTRNRQVMMASLNSDNKYKHSDRNQQRVVANSYQVKERYRNISDKLKLSFSYTKPDQLQILSARQLKSPLTAQGWTSPRKFPMQNNFVNQFHQSASSYRDQATQESVCKNQSLKYQTTQQTTTINQATFKSSIEILANELRQTKVLYNQALSCDITAIQSETKLMISDCQTYKINCLNMASPLTINIQYVTSSNGLQVQAVFNQKNTKAGWHFEPKRIKLYSKTRMFQEREVYLTFYVQSRVSIIVTTYFGAEKQQVQQKIVKKEVQLEQKIYESPCLIDKLVRCNFIQKNKQFQTPVRLSSELLKQRIDNAAQKREQQKSFNMTKLRLGQVKWDLVRMKRKQMEEARDDIIRKKQIVTEWIRFIIRYQSLKQYYSRTKSLIYHKKFILNLIIVITRFKRKYIKKVSRIKPSINQRLLLHLRNEFVLNSLIFETANQDKARINVVTAIRFIIFRETMQRKVNKIMKSVIYMQKMYRQHQSSMQVRQKYFGLLWQRYAEELQFKLIKLQKNGTKTIHSLGQLGQEHFQIIQNLYMKRQHLFHTVRFLLWKLMFHSKNQSLIKVNDLQSTIKLRLQQIYQIDCMLFEKVKFPKVLEKVAGKITKPNKTKMLQTMRKNASDFGKHKLGISPQASSRALLKLHTQGNINNKVYNNEIYSDLNMNHQLTSSFEQNRVQILDLNDRISECQQVFSSNSLEKVTRLLQAKLHPNLLSQMVKIAVPHTEFHYIFCVEPTMPKFSYLSQGIEVYYRLIYKASQVKNLSELQLSVIKQ